MAVVRSVSEWRDPKGNSRDNYHTAQKFAEILGLMPTASITFRDIDYIGIWLSGKIEQMMVGQALGEGALPRLLESPSTEDWAKAAQVLRFCTALRWLPEKSDHRKQPTTAVDGYWLNRLIKHNARLFGIKIGREAAGILLERVREIFSSEDRKLSSHMYRPAIEDHHQNHPWQETENLSVEGLRDVLLSWCEHDPEDSRSFVRTLLASESEIVRRIGIYILAQRWTELQVLFSEFVGPKFFDSGHLHEAYNLLKDHFGDLSPEDKARTVEAIRAIPAPARGADPARLLKRIQQRWLSAIAGKGDASADQWFAELQADPTVGHLADNPDFSTYFAMRVGPGSTPYSVQEIIAFAEARNVIERLNSFESREEWGEPTMEGLVSAVDEAVRIAPELFIQLLPEFLNAKRPFQHSVIMGLKQVWMSKDGRQTEIDWNLGWENLITFFEHLVGNRDFWEEKTPEAPAFVATRDWIVFAIAEFLDAGTRNDERAYSSQFLQRTWSLIEILLDKARAVDHPPDDAMSEAINSTKGKAVEVLFSQTLRVCRASDKVNGSHAEAWAGVRHLFDAELRKCKDANYEFSTLAGAYLPQLDYMDRDWAKAEVDHIFPADYPPNSICAIDGLAYAQFTLPVYAALAERGVLDRALRYELKGRNARERLLERIAAAYLWGEEALQSTRFSYLFKSGSEEDLEVVTRVFWGVRDGELSATQKERVLNYWERCVAWGKGLASPPVKLFSALSTLSSYLTTADRKDRELLEAVAPYVHDGYNADNFFAELLRLVEVSPNGVSAVLSKAIEKHVPAFDFEDRLKSLLLRLAEKGNKQEVILYAEKLRALGMQDLFDRLTRMD